MQSDQERIDNAQTAAQELWKLGFFAALENNGCIPQSEEQADALLEVGLAKRGEYIENVMTADTTLGQLKKAAALQRGEGYDYLYPDEATLNLAYGLLQDHAIKQACADYGFILEQEGLTE